MFQYKVSKKLSETVRGQKLLVYKTLEEYPNSTCNELVQKIGNRLETRQDPTRVVGYYLIVMSKTGHVTRTVKEVTEPVTDNKFWPDSDSVSE